MSGIILEPEEVNTPLPKSEVAAIVTYGVSVAITIAVVTIGLVIHSDLVVFVGFSVLAIGLIPTLALIKITDRNKRK